MLVSTPPKVALLHFHPTGQPSTWIIELATKLRSSGIDAHLDAWDLKFGQDVIAYKEKHIYDSSFKHVLVIFDEAYTGVTSNNVELQLARMELYKNVEQTRILPLVNLKEKDLVAALPPSVRSRHYLSFLDYNKAYEQLVNTIYDLSPKPKLGKPASPLSTNFFTAAPYIDTIQQYPTRINQQSRLFFEAFLAKIRKAAGNFKFFKTAWKEFLAYVSIKDLYPSFNTGSLIECLEELGKMKQEKDRETDFSLLVQELFLMAVVLGFKARNFSFLGNLLQGNYWGVQEENTSFVVFNGWSAATLSSWSIEKAGAITEQLYKEMSIHFPIKQLLEADLLCHYIALMKEQTWIPFFAPFIKTTTYPISWLEKLSIKKFFHKTKSLYGVEGQADFEKAMNKAYLHYSNLEFWPYSAVLPLEKVIPRKVAIL